MRINPLGLFLIIAPFAFMLTDSWWSALLSLASILLGCSTLFMPEVYRGPTVRSDSDKSPVRARGKTPKAGDVSGAGDKKSAAKVVRRSTKSKDAVDPQPV